MLKGNLGSLLYGDVSVMSSTDSGSGRQLYYDNQILPYRKIRLHACVKIQSNLVSFVEGHYCKNKKWVLDAKKGFCIHDGRCQP